MDRLLVIAGDEIRDVIRDTGLEAEFVDSLEDAARQLEDESFDAVVADLRGAGLSVEQLVGRLNRSGLPPLPMVTVLEDGDTQSSIDAHRLSVGWVTGEWLAGGGADLLAACLEGTAQVFEKLEALHRYEERHEQLVHAEKFAAVGLLAAEIAHEINNPSTFVITNLSVMKDYVDMIGSFHADLRRDLDEGPIDAATFEELEARHEIAFLQEDLQPLLDRSLAGLNRIHQIVQDLRYFSRDRTLESGPIRVGGLIEASVNLVRHEARYRTRIELDLGVNPPLFTDANRLSQVLLNVLLNAVQSIEPGDPQNNEVRVSASRRGEMLAVQISDTGVGMDDELLERVFDPFFTTRQPGEGTGLGLSISHDIMRSLGGEIEVTSTPGHGSVFTLLIPLDRPTDEEE